MKFTVEHTASDNHARAATLVTAHGVSKTPMFMPVGTLGLVKGLDAQDLESLGATMMLMNAYHLMVRAGGDRIAAAGGLHAFSGVRHSILTDSGGFQIFSLEGTRKVSDNGVVFRSHVDGDAITLTPESLVRLQEQLAPDIAMILDECPSGGAERDTVARATDRTHAWARRAVEARDSETVFFGIVQGGVHEDLRAASAQALSEMPFGGYAVGGVSVGEAPDDISRIVSYTAPRLPADKPRYLMGVGSPVEVVRGIAAGIDMFDCVMPSRNARNGHIWTHEGIINLRNARFRDDDEPLDPSCGCPVCGRYSRAFLRHLCMAKEVSFFRLATQHNLHFLMQMVEDIRSDIADGRFEPESRVAALQEIGF